MGDSLELISHRLTTIEVEVKRIGDQVNELEKLSERLTVSRKQTLERITALENVSELIHELSSDIKMYTKSVNDLTEVTKDNTRQITEIKLQPGALAMKWVWLLVTTLTTGFIGVLLTLFNIAPK